MKKDNPTATFASSLLRWSACSFLSLALLFLWVANNTQGAAIKMLPGWGFSAHHPFVPQKSLKDIPKVQWLPAVFCKQHDPGIKPMFGTAVITYCPSCRNWSGSGLPFAMCGPCSVKLNRCRDCAIPLNGVVNPMNTNGYIRTNLRPGPIKIKKTNPTSNQGRSSQPSPLPPASGGNVQPPQNVVPSGQFVPARQQLRSEKPLQPSANIPTTGRIVVTNLYTQPRSGVPAAKPNR